MCRKLVHYSGRVDIYDGWCGFLNCFGKAFFQGIQCDFNFLLRYLLGIVLSKFYWRIFLGWFQEQQHDVGDSQSRDD